MKDRARIPAASRLRHRLRGFMIDTSKVLSRQDREKDLRELRSWGANVVRWQLVAGTGDDLQQFKAEIKEKVADLKSFLPIMQELGLKVIVDMHWPPGTDSGGSIEGQANIFTAANKRQLKRTLQETWEDTVTELTSSQDKSVIFAYDLLNEPRGKPREWRRLAKRLGQSILGIHPEANIVVESQFAAPVNFRQSGFRPFEPGEIGRGIRERKKRRQLQNLKGEWKDFNKVIYSPHMYGPLDYSHQKLDPKKEDFGSEELIPFGGIEQLNRILKPIRSWQERYHNDFKKRFERQWTPRIYVGEFSAIRWAPDRERYVGSLIDIFENYGWDWTYHAFRESDVWNPELPGNVDAGRGDQKNDHTEFFMNENGEAEYNPTFKAVLNGYIQGVRENPDGNEFEEGSPANVNGVRTLESLLKSSFALNIMGPSEVSRRQVSSLIQGTDRRDELTGTSSDEIIIGGKRSDRLTGGEGGDQFYYQSIQDRYDRITDFEVDTDKIVLAELFANEEVTVSGYSEAIDQGYLQISSLGRGDSVIRIDIDGAEGRVFRRKSLIRVEGVLPLDLANAENFVI